jgi:hypothetical protein
LVTRFRSQFRGDPAGLDGCLLELQEILKLRASRSMDASLLKWSDRKWSVNKTIALLTMGSSVNVFQYYESPSRLEEILETTGLSWNVIEVPRAFHVIDVVLVYNSSNAPAYYGIQITRSPTPFKNHHTFDTCPSRSKGKLNKLWTVISNHFNLDEKTMKKFYVMLAPNCGKRDYGPPSGHSSDYYFSPSSILQMDDSSNSKELSSSAVKKAKVTNTP